MRTGLSGRTVGLEPVHRVATKTELAPPLMLMSILIASIYGYLQFL